MRILTVNRSRDRVRIMRWVNCALAVIVVVLAVLFTRGLVARSGSFALPAGTDDSAVTDGMLQPDSIQNLGRYVSIVSGKRLFKKGAQADVSRSVERVHRMTVQQLASSLTLVGIVGGDELVAVIMDGKSRKTYSLKEGEYINELLIDEITGNSVILRYESETMELKL